MESGVEYAKEKDFISEVVKEKFGYSNFTIILSQGTDQKNYFSRVHRVIVEETQDGIRFEKRLFLKTHGESEERNRRVKIDEKFRREALLYDAAKEYEDLQKKLVPEELKLKFPICLYADDRWLLMEDLTNFKSLDEKNLLDLEHLEVMVDDLAKFHALSFALRKKKPDVFKRFCEGLQKPNTGTKERRQFIANKVWNWTMNALDDVDIKLKLNKMKEQLLSEYESVSETDYSVIIHGDYNHRNVMFSYDEDGKIDQMRMIDFQLSYVTSPVADVFFVLFSSTTEAIRKDHYNRLLEKYFNNLHGFLELLGCDADSCYPAKVFREDLTSYFPREFITILVVVRLMCIAFKEKGKSDEPSTTILDYNSDVAEGVFAERIRGVIKDFVRFGYVL